MTHQTPTDRLHELLTSQLNDPESGRVICFVAIEPANSPNRPPKARIRSVLDHHNLPLPNSPLSELDRDTAIRVARELAAWPFGIRQVPQQRARAIADSFVDQFSPRARFYWFGEYLAGKGPVGLGWRGKGDLPMGGTVEYGFFVLDGTKTGCLIVSDED